MTIPTLLKIFFALLYVDRVEEIFNDAVIPLLNLEEVVGIALISSTLTDLEKYFLDLTPALGFMLTLLASDLFDGLSSLGRPLSEVAPCGKLVMIEQ